MNKEVIILDFIILGLVLLAAGLGYKRGFLESLGDIVGLIVAAIVASRFYPQVADWFGGTNFSNIIAFVIIFAITVKLVGLLFWVIGKIFQVVTVLPFISSFDSILGAALGLIEGILVLAIVLYVASKYPVNDWLTWQMGESIISTTLLKVAYIFIPLFPEALKKIKSVI